LNNLIKLVQGWSERLTLNILGIVYNGDKAVLQAVKDKFNEGTEDTKQAINELKSETPNKLSDLLNIEGLMKIIKPIIYIGVAFLAYKLYIKFKKR
jgi:hypothetical protein